MKVHVRIPHGCYLVEVKSPSAWTAIQLGFYMRRVPFTESPAEASMDEDHKTISEADLLLIGACDPSNRLRMKEINAALGLSP